MTGVVAPALTALDRLTAATETRAAVATLVSASGSTPKKAGARMFVDASGAVSGTVTIGGCVDARVLEAAAAVIAGGPARLLDLSLGEDEAWELGLTCGGAVSVFVEPMTPAVRAAYARARTAVDAGRAVVVATWLTDVPRRTVLDGGDATPEGVPVGAAVLRQAQQLLQAGVSMRGTAAALGESADVFFEIVVPPRHVVIIGAGEIARSLVPIARELGMETTVVDARDRFASRERFPLATAVRVGIPSEIVAGVTRGARTAIVLVAHDYKFELPVLRDVLRSPVGYIGMLGGKRRGATIRQMLAEEGFTPDELSRIQSPIGVDIGARSTAEIALSIVAELVKRETTERAERQDHAEDPAKGGRASPLVQRRPS